MRNNKKQTLATLTLTIVFLVSILSVYVAPAIAQVIMFNNLATPNSGQRDIMNYYLTNSSNQGVSSSFSPSYTGDLSAITVSAAKLNGLSGVTLHCGIYACTGAYGSQIPTGALLVESTDTFAPAAISNNPTFSYITFDFDDYAISTGTNYTVVFWATNDGAGNLGGTYYLRIAYHGSASPYNIATLGLTDAWSAQTGEMNFAVYGTPEVTPTPSPTPIPAALSYTLDMRGVGAVANPSSTTSAYGKEYFPKQGLGYTFNGHVWNYTNPYCNGAYTAYAGELRSKATGNTTVEAWTDLTNDDLTEVTNGSLTNGYFQFGTSAQTQYDSVELYQAWRINGTVTGSTETYTTDFIVRWIEPGVVVVEPTGSAELPTPTPVGYQPVGYGEIVWYIVALIVVLLPAGILGVLFRFGAWGFIIGLAIGAGLGYMLMPTIVPLWLVFVVVIGIVGMLLKGTVMGGGASGTEP